MITSVQNPQPMLANANLKTWQKANNPLHRIVDSVTDKLQKSHSG